MVPARLVLEDGTQWPGWTGRPGVRVLGEVVFNTSMAGYQEVITDPSYAGQIVVMTYPLIGNYGVDPGRDEAPRPAASGLIAREFWESEVGGGAGRGFAGYLERLGVAAGEGFDTRALTRHLRRRGTLRGVLTTDMTAPAQALAAEARAWHDQAPVWRVTTPEPYSLGGGRIHIAVVDFGVKRSIVRELAGRGCRVTVVPAGTPAADILALAPDGVVLSNGPGDPRDLAPLLDQVRRLAEAVPTFGICLGHQLLALAFGARVFRLPYGHRGGNHPVREAGGGRVAITVQNHGYAVDGDSALAAGFDVTHVHLHDGTVEGLRHRHLRAASVQFHPEAAPGPRDGAGALAAFLEDVRGAVAGRA
ncbi:MAG: carbamoyl phosphate synthase small subunit [Thermaerobacter sp.]|nr:carbamoyl phosphate synthase small subunit [Bacillota bacterium]REJ33345.1 MAG: carbamoyl phosphate synthase small subunit [Bacillota bacterium]